ncbi:hypothetical protein Pan241w_33070 [Gimesia alba]|uniref:Uncharacterized protein n=1 Tax=Gimesia alba TaxID=2527973 RepID=A0A517RH50_9PLAN|nr:hypothetical protein [Gimesia alba]QDT43207.1 hypothetical protein Pan241w_33070 [Gimesia alba]
MSGSNSQILMQQTASGRGKLIVVLLLILAAGVTTDAWYGVSLCLGAAIGMFLAEHFGSSRTREFLFLLGTPLLFFWLMFLATIWQQPDGASPALLSLGTLLILCSAIVPAALTVVALSIISAIVFKLTGLRLLKFNWSRSESQ